MNTKSKQNVCTWIAVLTFYVLSVSCNDENNNPVLSQESFTQDNIVGKWHLEKTVIDDETHLSGSDKKDYARFGNGALSLVMHSPLGEESITNFKYTLSEKTLVLEYKSYYGNYAYQHVYAVEKADNESLILRLYKKIEKDKEDILSPKDIPILYFKKMPDR